MLAQKVLQYPHKIFKYANLSALNNLNKIVQNLKELEEASVSILKLITLCTQTNFHKESGLGFL